MSELNRRSFLLVASSAAAVAAIGIPVEKRRPRFLIEDYLDKTPQTWVEFRLDRRDNFRIVERIPVEMEVNGLPAFNVTEVRHVVREHGTRVYTVLGTGNEDLWWTVDEVTVRPGDTLTLRPGDLTVSLV